MSWSRLRRLERNEQAPMKRAELQQLICEEKKKRGIKILAHTYQTPDIIDIADVTGDSFLLSQAAEQLDCDTVIMCGVRFMAETVKILSPEKRVILAAPRATCPMAIQIAPERLRAFRDENPDTLVCAYINTTAELKALSDVCVTSSSALRIIQRLDAKDILFIPDQNLGAYVRDRVTDKNIILWDGCCPTHHSITPADVQKAKAAHPGAALAVHPECRPDVLKEADFVGSTSAIIKFALETDGDVIIGTERGVCDYLREKHPQRGFYQLCENKLVCPNMKMTTLDGVYKAVTGEGGTEIELDEPLRLAAKRSIDNMLKYGKD